MAFASGSITFKRFFVDGTPITRADEALLKQLSARAIGADSVQTADYTEIGWVTGDHILDTDFDFATNVIADGLHFALRIDTSRPPPDLVRSYQRTNERTMLEASGREFLSKAERHAAREQARARADAEARSGAFRRMKQVPVFWDLPRNQAFLGATSSAAADHFMLLFRQTFDRSVTPASSGEMAARWSAKAGEARTYDDCGPALFINPPAGADQQEAFSGSADDGRSRDFLGTEWLTWLWYTSHVEAPEIVPPEGEPVTVLFEKALHLECAFKITGTTAITADGPTRLPEAPVALAAGKQPIRAGLQIATHGDAFSFKVRGDVMHFNTVQLPPPQDANSRRAVFEDRIDKLRDLNDAAERMYAAFLRRRLSGKWPQTLSAMRNWIAAGRYDRQTVDAPMPATAS